MIEGALKADGRIAAKNAVKIRAALRELADYKKLYLQYQETMPESSGNLARDRTRARAWAIMNVTQFRTEALASSLWRMWAEAYILGTVAAGEWLRITRELNKADDDVTVDWDNWKPGDRAAALMLQRPKAFQEILNSTNITIRGLTQTSITDIGNSLAEAIELGLDASSAALLIGRNVASPARALTIAITEQNRVISAATMARYKEAGLEKQEWAVSDPCNICAKNDGAVVPIGTSFPSGDTQPPAHPHCRCVLLPVIPGMEEEPEIPGATIVTPPPITPPAFLTPKEEIEQIVADLQEPKPLNAVLLAYEKLDNRPFVPGQWEILPRDVVKEAAVQNLMRAYSDLMGNPITRTRAEAMLGPVAIKRADKSLLEKGIIYKNGPIEVQFASAGLQTTKAQQLLVLKEVDKLQETNPKSRAVVHIDKNSKDKYGWAYGGKQDLWVTPAIIKNPTVGASEKGNFKMPVTQATTQLEYTLTHEWGHLIDDIIDGEQTFRRSQAITRLKAEYPNAFRSGYSGKNSKEFYAEMFTEYVRTGGQTPNLLVQAFAREFNWKVPEIAGPKIGYVAAKNKPDVYLADIEAAEQKLKGFIPTVTRADGTVVPDWKFASGGSAPENIQLRNLMKEQGFLGKPRVVNPGEFQKIVDQGAQPIYRGLGAPTQESVDEYVTRLLTGDEPYIGRGFFGDGTYFASDRGIAERFAAQDVTGEINFKFGEVVEGVLDPQAKIIDVEDLWKLRDEYVERMPFHGELAQAYEDDIGLFATTQGYDVILNTNPFIGYTPDGQRRYAPGSYYTILNRTALIMKGKL
jgi:SPP1 gp7 family putative phage head morphogenesis protein